MKIQKIEAREILDSRGNPTVEAKVFLSNNLFGSAKVPSGASTGKHEAYELRDGGKRYGGNGVLKAVKNINTILNKKLKGMDVLDIKKIDEKMIKIDGTVNKSKLGANAILAVSLAVARAGALSKNMPLYKYIRDAYKLDEKKWRMPVPTMNIINGGKHADNTISTQEFMIIPMTGKMQKRVEIGSNIFHSLKSILKSLNQATSVGDEGGFAPNIDNITGYTKILDEDEIGLNLIVKAIKKAGYKPKKQVCIGLDVAASEFYTKGKGYDFNFKQKNKGKKYKKYDEVLAMYESWIKKYPIISIEDPFDEDAWGEWADFTKKLKKKISIVGDDLFVTNKNRLQKGIDEKVSNAILIKLNQIGTLSETIETIYLAKKNKYKISVSHRSGETADTFIADLAVAVNSDFIKTGSLSRSERVEKYNRLMEIELELGL